VNEINRSYPFRQTAAHVVGFSRENQGLEGLEYYYDSILRGSIMRQDELKKFVLPADKEISRHGADLVLTLDLNIQKYLEEQLMSLIRKTGAKGGTAMLMQPESGAVLALASLPSFDPNYFWKYGELERTNHVFTDPVYPAEAGTIHLQNYVGNQAEEPPQEIMESAATGSIIFPVKTKKSITLHTKNLLENQDADICSLTGLDYQPMSELFNRDTGIDTTATSSLQLLSTIASIVNGGKKITPHLLAGVLDRKSNQYIPTEYGSAADADTGPVSMQPENRLELLQLIRDSGQSGPDGSLLLDASQTLFDSSFGLLVGIAPWENPEMVLLVTLNQASVSPDSWPVPTRRPATAPMLALGHDLLPRIMNLAHVEPPVAPPSEIEGTEVALTPDVLQPEPGMKTAQESPTFAMPSIVGISLRSGLRTLQQYKMRIRINGSGMITAQYPNAGSKIRKGDSCILKLHKSSDEKSIPAKEKQLAKI